jgi:hypothetical protein
MRRLIGAAARRPSDGCRGPRQGPQLIRIRTAASGQPIQPTQGRVLADLSRSLLSPRSAAYSPELSPTLHGRLRVPLARFPGAGAHSYQEARRLLRAVPGAGELPVRCLPTHRTRSPGPPGGLVNDAQGACAADALLAVREKDGRSSSGGQAKAAGRAER